MSILKSNFNPEVVQSSPVQADLKRVVSYDEDGNEFVSYVEVDYPKIQQENGTVDMWNLNALLKAGINPNFPIRTGLNTRLEGIDAVNSAAAYLDEILAEESNKE